MAINISTPVGKAHVFESNPYDKVERSTAELLVTFDFLTIVAYLPSRMSKRLAIWLQKNHNGSEFFKLNGDAWMTKELGYDTKLKPNLYGAIADLLAYSVLAKSSKKGYYYVNNKLLNL